MENKLKSKIKLIKIIFLLIVIIFSVNFFYLHLFASKLKIDDQITLGKSYYIKAKGTDENDIKYYLYAPKKYCNPTTEKKLDYYLSIRYGIIFITTEAKKGFGYNLFGVYTLKNLDYKINKNDQSDEVLLNILVDRIKSDCNLTFEKLEIYGDPI